MTDHFYTIDPTGELAMQGAYFLENIECHVLKNQEGNDVGFYRWYNPSNGDHFYCLDPYGEIAGTSGYTFERKECTVYKNHQLNTVPFYRWYHPVNGDHFYTLDPTGELAPASGYTSEGIACYVYRTQEPDTVPLYRWYHAGNGDHFYCLDPHGELAPSSGYASEGIACYVPIDPLKNLTEFYRWRNLNTGNHFYSIDPRAEGKSDFVSEGIACFVYQNHVPNTVPLHRMFSIIKGDHFYNIDGHNLTGDPSYTSDGFVVCYVFPDAQTNTVPFFRWFHPGGCQKTITVHFKSLLTIDTSISEFWINQFSGMGSLFMQGGISVKLGTIEDLSANPTLLQFRNLNIGNCWGFLTTPHMELFLNRNSVGPTDIVVYLVSTLINATIPPKNVIGCAAYPAYQPGCVVIQVEANDKWLVAHEIAHVLGLFHVCGGLFPACVPSHANSLMFPDTGWTNLPPNLSTTEFQTMHNSNLAINC